MAVTAPGTTDSLAIEQDLGHVAAFESAKNQTDQVHDVVLEYRDTAIRGQHLRGG